MRQRWPIGWERDIRIQHLPELCCWNEKQMRSTDRISEVLIKTHIPTFLSDDLCAMLDLEKNIEVLWWHCKQFRFEFINKTHNTVRGFDKLTALLTFQTFYLLQTNKHFVTSYYTYLLPTKSLCRGQTFAGNTCRYFLIN